MSSTPEPATDRDQPADGTERAGWTGRLPSAFARPSRSQLVVGLLLAVLGFGAVTQLNANEEDATYAGYREQDLIDVLNGLAGTTQRAQAEVQRLEAARADLLADTTRRQTALDQARSQLDALNILAGRVPVTGPGVRVTITETTDQVDVDDFIDLVQELRSIGAEAIQVNGEVRLVAQSSFEQGTGGLYVDGKLLEPPYVVDAIGEPATLAGAVTFARGPKDAFEAGGAEVEVDQRQSIDIEAVRAGD